MVEIDGERAFTWFVDPGALRERLLPTAPGREQAVCDALLRTTDSREMLWRIA